jgi:hypothetical protein
MRDRAERSFPQLPLNYKAKEDFEINVGNGRRIENLEGKMGERCEY